MLHADEARTQKATGLFWAAANRLGPYVPPFTAHRAREVCDGALVPTPDSRAYPFFARPCPLRPRHGFVESRVVRSTAEVRDICREVLAEDQDGELLLMSVIQSSVSAVYTPGLLTIGPGNDGATSGRNTVSLPLNSSQDTARWLSSGADGGTAYVELVGCYVVQVRAGPPLEPDVEARAIHVRRVVQARGPLLDWEQDVKSLDPATDVVWHPGGSPLSHYAVHARLCGVEVLFDGSLPPAEGSTIVVNGGRSRRRLPLRPDSVREGAAAAQVATRQWRHSDIGRAVALAALVAQNSPALIESATRESLFLIGWAAAALAHVGAALVVGEHRHFSGGSQLDRSYLYKKCWQDREFAAFAFQRARRYFVTHQSSRKSGFGGRPWADCARATQRLAVALRALQRSKAPPSRASKVVRRLMLCANTLLSLVHNNGWWLNKVAEREYFDWAASGDPRIIALTLPLLGELFYPTATPAEESLPVFVLQVRIPGFLVQVRPAGECILHVQVGRPSRYRSADLEISPATWDVLYPLTCISPSFSVDSTSRYVLLDPLGGGVYGASGVPVLVVRSLGSPEGDDNG